MKYNTKDSIQNYEPVLKFWERNRLFNWSETNSEVGPYKVRQWN